MMMPSHTFLQKAQLFESSTLRDSEDKDPKNKDPDKKLEDDVLQLTDRRYSRDNSNDPVWWCGTSTRRGFFCPESFEVVQGVFRIGRCQMSDQH
jgi:hypothetical protein